MSYTSHKFRNFAGALCAHCGITKQEWTEGKAALLGCSGVPEFCALTEETPHDFPSYTLSANWAGGAPFYAVQCRNCGVTRGAWIQGGAPMRGCSGVLRMTAALGEPGMEPPNGVQSSGECPHCGQYIGVAVATHARYCDQRPEAAAIAVPLHDHDKAMKGECECPVCAAARAASAS